MKRTYNLPEPMVVEVREAVETHGVAQSQDAFVRMAIGDLLMRLRYERESRLFAAAAEDPEAIAERAELEAEFSPLDRASWPD
ncbi:MAG: hypothetical protein ABR564_00190 [Candidatus Dormibacteria bacterium]